MWPDPGRPTGVDNHTTATKRTLRQPPHTERVGSSKGRIVQGKDRGPRDWSSALSKGRIVLGTDRPRDWTSKGCIVQGYVWSQQKTYRDGTYGAGIVMPPFVYLKDDVSWRRTWGGGLRFFCNGIEKCNSLVKSLRNKSENKSIVGLVISVDPGRGYSCRKVRGSWRAVLKIGKITVGLLHAVAELPYSAYCNSMF